MQSDMNSFLRNEMPNMGLIKETMLYLALGRKSNDKTKFAYTCMGP